jgi:hypothetical protein
METSPDGTHIAYGCRGEGGATPFRICTSRLDRSDFRRFSRELAATAKTSETRHQQGIRVRPDEE